MSSRTVTEGALTTEIVVLAPERLQREIDELRGEVANLAHRLNHALVNLQSQLDDKVNAEPMFQP